MTETDLTLTTFEAIRNEYFNGANEEEDNPIMFDPPIRALQLEELTPEIVADIVLLSWATGDLQYHPNGQDPTSPHLAEYEKYNNTTNAFDGGYPMAPEVYAWLELLQVHHPIREHYIASLKSEGWL